MSASKECGHFSDDGREYIITTPDTPRPWINYLHNGDYCALCSHVGGGFSFYQDHRVNAVLRRGLMQHIEDLPGRFFYLKDESTGEIWSATVHPVGKCDPGSFEARHGMGYTTVAASWRGVASSVRYFVPHETHAELWDLEVRNTGRRHRRLSIYSCASFSLGNVSFSELEPNFHPLFNEVVADSNGFTATHKYWHGENGWSEHGHPWGYRAFLRATRPPVRILNDHEAFFGSLRGYHNPIALESDLLPDAPRCGKNLVCVCQWRVTLAPGRSWKLGIAIGVHDAVESVVTRALRKRLENPAWREKAWRETRAHWARLFAPVAVRTPEPAVDRMVNHWNKHQLLVNFHFGRGPSYFHKGQYPAMRDSCQDAFGVIPLNPAMARENLLRIGRFFFKDGQACGGCNRAGLPEGPSVKVDLPLWFVLSVVDYLRETGDWDILDVKLPLMDSGESTVLAKMIRGIGRMIAQRGPHGLPLMGKGDWNDAANAVGAGGKGESVWLAQFLCLAVQEITPVLERRGQRTKLAVWKKRIDEIRRILDRDCWDGKWFVRAFRDDGRPLGVQGEKEGFLWINSQTWAVIGGVDAPERLHASMDAVEKHLGTKYGLMNVGPAYTKFDPMIGILSAFLAGWKENGAVFSHASSFNVVARAMLGRGREALDLWRRLQPGDADPDIYKVEPYVYSQFRAGPASEEFGRGAYHWLTGTAAWMFRAMTDYIIGVRPELDGLRIAPAVDPSWTRFSMRRRFRGADYEFQFENPDGVETGVRQVWLDDEPVTGTRLPLPTAARHRVRVLMASCPPGKTGPTRIHPDT